MHGYELQLLPVTHPGVEQKATWLQVRQQRPDYVLLWGWGVMNSTALKEAVATGYPREKMYGVWWSGAEPDVKDVGDGAKGYNALVMQHGAGRGQGAPGHHQARARQGPGHRAEGGGRRGALQPRRCMSAMLGVEAVRARAGALRQGQADDRRGGPLGPGEPGAGRRRRSTRWASPDLMRPVSTSCADHMGRPGRASTPGTASKWDYSLRLATRPTAGHQADGQVGCRQGTPTEKKIDAAHCPSSARADKVRGRAGGATWRLPTRRGAAQEPTWASALLAVNGIEVIYNHVILVLKGVSLTVPEGGIVALLGSNGAGKTTTLRAVSQPAAGRARRGHQGRDRIHAASASRT